MNTLVFERQARVSARYQGHPAALRMLDDVDIAYDQRSVDVPEQR